MLLLLAMLLSTDTVEEHAKIQLSFGEKRFVLRYPKNASSWNGRLLVGAHGGRGGESFSRDGRVIATDETSLDDVVGDDALAHGFAYASVDRDGLGASREGLRLVEEFTDLMKERLAERLEKSVEKTYLAGLSAGGGIARFAAEEDPPRYDGILLIVGVGGDAPSRAARQKKMAALWPHIEADGPSAYAEVTRTPVEARRFWPFMGHSLSSGGAPEPGENTTGALTVPTIEVAGTYDDLAYAEILIYKDKVRARRADERHRLYRVEGAWHVSRDDDAVSSFQFMGSSLGLREEDLDAMATGASYLSAVHEALLLLDAWVEDGVAPPPDRTITESESLLP